jgi:hypothetical protein
MGRLDLADDIELKNRPPSALGTPPGHTLTTKTDKKSLVASLVDMSSGAFSGPPKVWGDWAATGRGSGVRG